MKLALIAIALLLLFNTAIAGLLTVIEFGQGFWINLLFSQCIGCCIALVNSPLILRHEPGWQRWLLLAAGLPASVVLGSALAHLLASQAFSAALFGQSFAIGMMFALLGVTVFLLAERVHQLDNQVRQSRLTEAQQSRREIEAHLKLLQAQIEPHFLFNTLANVGSLIDSDPPRARRLLDRLNDWLRVALVRTRSEQAKLGDELALLENWLEILADRYGPRLTWQIDADAACRSQPFPPMLLQPLAENAIRHGIEPKIGGGHLCITARLQAQRLRIEVSDNGIGLAQTSTQTSTQPLTRTSALALNGTGLANIRARLQALYGDAARLDLNAPASGGVTASLELPCAH